MDDAAATAADVPMEPPKPDDQQPRPGQQAALIQFEDNAPAHKLAATRDNMSSAMAMTATAFAGAVDAHNALLERFQEVDGKVATNEKRQAFLLEQIQELSNKHENVTTALQERTSTHDGRLDDLHAQLTESQKAQEQMLTRFTDFTAEQERKVKELDQDITSKLGALDKTVQDLISKQSEIVTRTLPQWQAELSGQILSLATDLSQLRESNASRFNDFEERLVATNTAGEKACKDIDLRLTSEADGLKSWLTTVDERTSSLVKDLAQTSARLDRENKVLEERLESLGQDLRMFVKAEDDASQTQLRSDLLAKLQRLEDALKQETLERLQHMEQNARDHEGLKASGAAARAEIVKTQEAHREANKQVLFEELQDIKHHMSEELAAERRQREKAMQDQMATVQSSLTSSNERLSNTTTALLEKLQAQSDGFETKTKDEIRIALIALRGEEDAKVVQLEASLQKVENEFREHTERFQMELHTFQDTVAGSQHSNGAKAEEVAAAIVAKLEPVKQAVANLSQDVDELSRMQEQCEGGIVKLEDQVSGIQRKAAPIDDAQKRLLELEWYLSAERTTPFATVRGGSDCLSCGRRAAPERSLSPSASQRWNSSVRAGGLGDRDQSPPAMVGWSWRAHPQPQAPMSARPASASYYRRAGEAPEALQPQVTPPAGTAFSAARFQRRPDAPVASANEAQPRAAHGRS